MESLQQKAYSHIQNMILENKLKPHEIYSETKFAREIGISRTPFRDAVHRLAQDGYLDIIPNKGFQVHTLTVQDVSETFQMRSAIEGYCTLQITRESGSPKALKLFSELDELTFQMGRILRTNHSIEEFWDYDRCFHVVIVHYMENALFNHTFDSYMYRIDRLAALSLLHKNRMENTHAEHTAILNAMKAGDVTAAMDATLRHMEIPKNINMEDLQQL